MRAFLAVMCFVCAFALGAQEIGRVVKAVGKIVRINKSKKLDDFLSAGARIYQNDQIKTLKSSYIKILLNDDTIFQLGGNSKFTFEKYSNHKGKKKKAIYRLLYGKMRSIFIKQQSEDVMISTPSISMGIRGTEVLADVFWDKNDFKASLPKTEVALLSGKVSLDLSAVGGTTVELKAGEVFDSSKAMETFSVQKMPVTVIKKLRMGKDVFLYEAKNPGQSFPSAGLNEKTKIELPAADLKNAIGEGQQKDVRKHFMRKEPVVAPPPPPITDDTTSTAIDGSVNSDGASGND